MYVITKEMWEKYGKRRSIDAPLREGPFLFPMATALIEAILKPHMMVLESGSGGSTIWFAERAHRVLSYETDFTWHKKVSLELVRRNLQKKARVIYAPSLLEGKMPTYPDISNKRFDLIFADSVEQARIEFVKKTIGLTRVLGWYVIDNANRPGYVDLLRKVESLGWPRYVVPSIEPGQFFQTNFYRRPADSADISL